MTDTARRKLMLEQRFRVTPGCWEWTGSKSSKGYGKLQIGKEHLRAHRVSYEIYNGTAPSPEQFILHSCDNPGCVNPEHLRIGDNAENMKEKKEKKRSAAGETHGMSKLSNLQAEQILAELLKGDWSMRKIASKHGVSLGCVSNIKYRSFK
jgi:hypothetical protein